jgi:hypothetical protein
MSASSSRSTGSNPPPRFDPQEFEAVANWVATNPSESHLRTAVGRLYYSLFLLAREKTNLTRRRGRSLHDDVINEVRRLSGDKTLGDHLFTLKEMREVADYQLEPDAPKHYDWQKNWDTATRLGSRVRVKLEALP